MKTIKKLLSGYYYAHLHDSALGYRMRRYIYNKPVAELRPFNEKAAVSDMFVWRCDHEWDTRFELFNISSFIFPADNIIERCNIIFFDENGKAIAETVVTLQPFEKVSLDPGAYINECTGVGTFAVFHHSDDVDKFSEYKSHITERGYVSYKREGDAIGSFCHGNLQSLSQGPDQKGFSYVAATSKPMRYHPQLILSDCNRVELIYTNPSPRAQPLKLHLFDKNNSVSGVINAIIPARGVRVINVDNADHAIHTFDNVGPIIMWRPVIKKYYKTHFDALHG